MKKKVIVIFLIFFVAAFVQKFVADRKAQHLNLVIISIDALRADHVGAYGYEKNTTPNIDAWAKNATVFTNMSTVVPMTFPSFTALMTGKDPLNSRVVDNGTSPLVSKNTRTLASVLSENGYKTAGFVSGSLREDLTALNQGFSTYKYDSFKGHYFPKGRETYFETDKGEWEGFLSQAGTFLENNKNNKFFLWVHLMDPHAPYQPPPDLLCKFDGKNCSYIKSKSPGELEIERASYQFCQNSAVPASKVDLFEGLYDDSIAYSDRLVGRILDSIKKEGLDKNTLVVLYSDHGEGFDHNYFFNHRGVLYNSATHIVFMVKDPLSLSRPNFSSLQIQNPDVFPTILSLLNISSSIHFDGINFSSFFHRDLFSFLVQPSGRNFSYSLNNKLSKYSVSDGHYKYIFSLPFSCLLNGHREELYDVKNDPGETKNILLENKDIAQSLKSNLFARLANYNLPLSLQKRPLRSATPSAATTPRPTPQTSNNTDSEGQFPDLSY